MPPSGRRRSAGAPRPHLCDSPLHFLSTYQVFPVGITFTFEVSSRNRTVRPPTKIIRELCSSKYGHSMAYPHRSEEHTSELQSLMRISYAVFCLNKKMIAKTYTRTNTRDTH